ncbi:MAG: hypothetical protein GY793_05955 [Proteobacteria bacterium]|nr:hypothetical protein [Pseudomonadota bacterium]
MKIFVILGVVLLALIVVLGIIRCDRPDSHCYDGSSKIIEDCKEQKENIEDMKDVHPEELEKTLESDNLLK